MRARSDLVALVGARICHDLVSPLGAIGNGVELLGLAGLPQGPEMALIAESVDNANARLRFFRIAYGGASPDQHMGRAEITATLSAVARGGRLSFDWQAPGDQPRDEVRAVFLVLQCLETALPYGGAVQVARADDGWIVTGESSRLRVQSDLWDSLLDDRLRIDISAAQVQFALLPEVMAGLGRKIGLTLAPDRLVIRF